MEKYKSQYPTLRQAKTNWSKKKDPYAAPHLSWVRKATDFRHSRDRLRDSIMRARFGNITLNKQTKIVREEADDQHIYHVTHTKHVAKIQKHGILPMKTSNWVKAGDKDRYGGGEVYAFTHKTDAHAWAGRMEWAHHQTLGSGKISIVTAKRPSDRKFEVDSNDPLSQAGKKGDWLKTHGSIEPHHIVSVEPYHPKRLGEDKIGKPSPSVNDIAAKHKVPVSTVLAQLAKGIEVEKEHTKDDFEAAEIARDHMHEFPDYYDRLNKMEKKAKKDIKEGYDPEKEILKNRIAAHKNVAAKMAAKHGEQSQEAAFHRALVRRWEKEIKEDHLKEEVPNSVGGGMSPTVGGEGNIHGFDPIMGKPVRRKKFAGKQVFVVDPTTYHKAYLGKRKYEHYERYLEGSPYAEEIREYGRKNWAEPIIIENEQTGAMVYLKYGSK